MLLKEYSSINPRNQVGVFKMNQWKRQTSVGKSLINLVTTHKLVGGSLESSECDLRDTSLLVVLMSLGVN